MSAGLALLMRRRPPPIPVLLRAHSTATSAVQPSPSWSSALLRDRARMRIADVDRSFPAQESAVSPQLIDSFNRQHTYLRISLTEKCNLRCTYCMPEEGAPLTAKEHLMTTPELLRVARTMVRNGVKKVRLTGGEPTLRKDVVEVVRGLQELADEGLESIGMTSNGIALRRKLPTLVDAGLTSLNLSLDTLDPFKFELITRRRGHETVMAALETALGLIRPRGSTTPGLDSVKLNAVVIRGVNDGEILDFVELTRDKNVEVRFIEYMPFEDNRWATRKLVPLAEMLDTIRKTHPTLSPIRTDRHDTTKHYQIPGYRGRVGFISSMTEHFCGGCTRLRLGADGRLKTCLFGEPTLDVVGHLRQPDGLSDHALMDLIGRAVKQKKAKHGGHEGAEALARDGKMGSMVLIGG